MVSEQPDQWIADGLHALAFSHRNDLASQCKSDAFCRGGRHLSFWRKEGVIAYSLQGPIAVLPVEYRASASDFRGMWTEAGTVENIEQAYELLISWIFEGKDVDELPARAVRRNGISGV